MDLNLALCYTNANFATWSTKLDKAVSKLCAQSLSGDTGIWDW